MTTYRQTLPFSLAVAVFIILGAISIGSPWPLIVLPLPFLFARLVQKGLSNPAVLQDDKDDHYKPLLAEIDVIRQYSEGRTPR